MIGALPETPTPNFLPALVVVGVYALFWSLSRWHNIALPTRKLLRAQIEGLRSRLYTENSDLSELKRPVTAAKSALYKTYFTERLETQLTEIVESQHLGGGLFNFIFWSRGHLIAGWKEVHDIERQLVELYSVERTKEYLKVAEKSLRDIKSSEAIYLADEIKAQVRDFNERRLKALLQEALRVIYAYHDAEYIKLVTWHNKAAWLMVVALAFIFLILSYHTGAAALLLAGAVGGLISRLTRAVRNRKAVPTDYGAYWTSFYLSPPIGALAAWAGVLLVVALVDIGVLSGPFEQVRWEGITLQGGRFILSVENAESLEATTAQEPRTVNLCLFLCDNHAAADTTAAESDNDADTDTVPDAVTLTLSVALLFGFSERLLNNMTGRLEGAFEKKPADPENSET